MHTHTQAELCVELEKYGIQTSFTDRCAQQSWKGMLALSPVIQVLRINQHPHLRACIKKAYPLLWRTRPRRPVAPGSVAPLAERAVMRFSAPSGAHWARLRVPGPIVP